MNIKATLVKRLAGAVAGGSGCFLNTPFDVVKSRMQRESDSGNAAKSAVAATEDDAWISLNL